MEISENTIYYALSTIAQTEAALMAVMVTFIFFIIQSLENKLRDNLIARSNEQTKGQARENVLRLIYSKQFEQANNSFHAEHPIDFAIKQWLIQKKKLEKILFAPLFFGLGTITLSILGLTFTELLKGSNLGFNVVFGIFVLFVTSIFLIVKDIRSFFK